MRPVSRLAKQQAAERSVALPVRVSLKGGAIPSQAVVDASDYILLHGNGVSNADTMVTMINRVRAMVGVNCGRAGLAGAAGDVGRPVCTACSLTNSA